MVSETYVEWLVARKPSVAKRFLKVLLITLTVIFFIIGILNIPMLLLAVVTGVGAYFAYMNADIEYEYLYLDKEISIDKVLAKSKRKKAAVYDVERIEIMAPAKSHRLDAYKNRTFEKNADYGSGAEGEPENRYVIIYDGNMKIIWEPSAEMVKAIQMIAPRKIFTD